MTRDGTAHRERPRRPTRPLHAHAPEVTGRRSDCPACTREREEQDAQARAIGYALLGLSAEQARALDEACEREEAERRDGR